MEECRVGNHATNKKKTGTTASEMRKRVGEGLIEDKSKNALRLRINAHSTNNFYKIIITHELVKMQTMRMHKTSDLTDFNDISVQPGIPREKFCLKIFNQHISWRHNKQ